MLIPLAWKNIWRNKKRSLVIIMAISSGLWGGLFLNAVWIGMVDSMVETAISRNLAHLQIHQPGYKEDMEIRQFIPYADSLIQSIRRIPHIQSVSSRTLILGIASSPASAYGVEIVGINPEDEARVCEISKNMIEGSYFKGGHRNPIVIGSKLAERLNLKVRSKVVLNFQNLQNDITYIACRVEGIYKTNSSQFDEMNVFVNQKDLYKALDSKSIAHEIAIRVQSLDSLSSVQQEIGQITHGLLVENWKEVAPELAYMSDMMDYYAYIFIGIILAALLFGITNTMLMSVVERFRELGMLMAIGMYKMKVFGMILSETLFLSLTGGICGMFIAAITIFITGSTGIDLTFIAVSLESFGTATILYPFLPASIYISLTLMIIIAAVIASILPAWKAIKLTPAEAIRN